MIYKFSILLTLCLLPFLAFGQYGDIGIYSGIAVLKGETVHKTVSLKGAGYTGGAVYRRHIGQKFGLKGSVGFGNYKGDDAFYPGQSGRRNFKFKTNFIEASAVAEFSFFNEKRYERGIFYGSFSPFLNAGIGFLHINPVAEAEGPIVIVEEDFNFQTNIFTVPIGGGLRMDVSENITISGYVHFYLLAGDYLDGLSVSGNPGIDDYLFIGGLMATYHPSKDAGQRYNLSSL
jgi:hypothetical protein